MDDQISDPNAREIRRQNALYWTSRDGQAFIRQASARHDRPTLDWHDRRHWAGGLDHVWSIPRGRQGADYHGRWVPCDDKRKRCHLCGQPTFLRDEQGRPSHKVCAERAMETP